MISVLKKILLITTMTILSACATESQKEATMEFKKADVIYYDPSTNSVKITNIAQTHGGTGTIIESGSKGSLVLTNSHVCAVVEDGGLVIGMNGSFAVVGYKKSEDHDLCLIKVLGNLRGRAKLARRPPVPYYEAATISGHPSLYPNVKTQGHVSGRQVIEVLVGFKPCTKEDLEDEQKVFLCVFVGGLPILKTFDSVLVTATIMPGSSGSAVYNSDMELSGVVFAGSGPLAYAWTVPYEYVMNFLLKESRRLKYEKPSNLSSPLASKKSETENFMKKLQSVCESPDKVKIKELCEIANSNLVM